MASVHTSHGIMFQDFSCPAYQEVEGDMPSIPVVSNEALSGSSRRVFSK
jgi:hypothetical protein